MKRHLPFQKFSFLTPFFIFIVSCGSDMVEDIVETYDSGNKKVYVRYHPDPNVLERHFYNDGGEMVHLERDSLSYGYDLQHFMSGTWIIDKMTVDGEVMFEKDSVYNPDNPPNIYTFSNDKLLVSGPKYSADYKIGYLDSSQVELDGIWTYGIKGEKTYRTQRIFDIDYIQILSYYTFRWIDFLEDSEKEEEVLFRRIDIPIAIDFPDTTQIDLPDTTQITTEKNR